MFHIVIYISSQSTLLPQNCTLMPIYVFVMDVLCLQCMLGPHAVMGHHVD